MKNAVAKLHFRMSFCKTQITIKTAAATTTTIGRFSRKYAFIVCFHVTTNIYTWIAFREFFEYIFPWKKLLNRRCLSCWFLVCFLLHKSFDHRLQFAFECASVHLFGLWCKQTSGEHKNIERMRDEDTHANDAKGCKTQSEYECKAVRVFAQKFIKWTEMEINQSDDIHNTVKVVEVSVSVSLSVKFEYDKKTSVRHKASIISHTLNNSEQKKTHLNARAHSFV